jgi:hypothetical protein
MDSPLYKDEKTNRVLEVVSLSLDFAFSTEAHSNRDGFYQSTSRESRT